MKILLDENIDIRLKHLFPPAHAVYTVRDMRWNGIKNGELLKLIAENNFEAWIVVDKNIPYQQNLDNLPCAIIVLDVIRNTLPHLRILMNKLLDELNKQLGPGIIVIK